MRLVALAHNEFDSIEPSSSFCVCWEDDMIIVIIGVQKIDPLVWGVLKEHLCYNLILLAATQVTTSRLLLELPRIMLR